jgi:hypothetical protein
MLASSSPLTIVDYAITKMDFGLVPIPPNTEDIFSHFNQYDVEIDFDIFINKVIRVSISAKINQGKVKKPGYSICAEAGCFFQFDEKMSKTLSESQRSEIESFSTVYMALNTIRGLISSFTSNAPYGRYILPSIDLNKLISEKKRLIIEAQQSKDIQHQNKTTKKTGQTKTAKKNNLK